MPKIVDPKIRAQETLANDVDQADRLLEAEIGPSSALLTREWTLRADDGLRTAIELRLSDFTGNVQTAFAPDELRNTYRMQTRLHLLWGDLLQIRSHKQLQRLNESLKQLEVQ